MLIQMTSICFFRRSPIPDPGAFVLAGTGFSNRRVSTVGTNPPAPHKK